MKVPSKPWQDPATRPRSPALSGILKDSGRDNTITETPEAQRQKQNNWTAQLHFVWDYILASFVLRAEVSEKDAGELFGQFWNRVVDGKSTSSAALGTIANSGRRGFPSPRVPRRPRSFPASWSSNSCWKVVPKALSSSSTYSART